MFQNFQVWLFWALLWSYLDFCSPEHPVDMCSTVLLRIMWKKNHFTMFILRPLTNSLHSEPMRHVQASLKEGLNNISIPFCFINSPHLPFFLSHSLSLLSSHYLWSVLQATQASDLQMHAYYVPKFKWPKAWQPVRDTLFHDGVTCL